MENAVAHFQDPTTKQTVEVRAKKDESPSEAIARVTDAHDVPPSAAVPGAAEKKKPLNPVSDMVQKLQQASEQGDAPGALMAAQEIVTTLQKELNISKPGSQDDGESFEHQSRRARRLEERIVPSRPKTEAALIQPPTYEGIV
jgi:hypothetical protein